MGVINRLIVFSSTPDIAEVGFVVPVLTAPLPELGSKAKEYGFDGLEFLPNPDRIPSAMELKASAETAGVNISVINSGRMHPQGYALLHRDPAIRRTSIDIYKQFVDLAGELGARVGMGMARGSGDTTVDDHDLAAVMDDVFGEVAEHAAAASTVVMLEPADPGVVTAVATVSEAVDIATRIDSPGFAVMLDTYQLAEVETSIEQGIRDAAGRADHIQLYDPGHWPPGVRDPRHRLDWDSVAASLASAGFQGSGSVVLAPEGDAAAAARTSAQFLRDLLMQ